MPTPARRRSRTLFAIAALAVALVVPASGTTARGTPSIDIQFLNVSDWHGQLDPASVNGVNIGGAAALSSYLESERAANENTITLTAGDDFGATPPLSNFFDEVPAVLAQRLMGIQVGTFGNHNFDRGTDHLQEMIDLAKSTDPAVPGEPFDYVVSNLAGRDDALDGVADYKLFEVGRLTVAVIGAINEEAPGLVFPGNFGDTEPTDSIAAVKAAQKAARKQGADVFVAIAHKGVTGFDGDEPRGELIDFARALDGFHIIFGDHTDVQWSGTINGALVTENKSKGVSYSRTVLTVNAANGKLIDRSHTFVSPVSANVTPDPAIVEMLAPYRVELAEIFDQRIGVATGTFPNDGTPRVQRSFETALGNLIADAMRAEYGTQIAMLNGGGMRSPLPSTYVPLDVSLDRTAPEPYDLVIGDVYTVLPFGNAVVTRDITGAQLWAAMENAVSRISAVDGTGTDGRFAQISGFRLTYDSTRAPGDRVLSITLDDGTVILDDSSQTITLAAPDFINTGGDGYTMFLDGIATTRALMADVLLEHIRDAGTIAPYTDGRIDNVAF